jgi:ATP-dependent helicase/DNAse subunit B
VLADRFIEAASAGSDPVFVVPSVPDSEVLERELAGRQGVLLGGLVVTFDDLAGRILERTGGAPEPPPDVVRGLLLRRLAARAPQGALGRSARFAGFAAALGRFTDECSAVGITQSELQEALTAAGGGSDEVRELAQLVAAWREALAAERALDRPARLAEAARRASRSLAAWGGEPLFVYGFEELTRAQSELVSAIAARADVVCSLPFEPARPAFDALSGPFERLAARADTIEELAPAASGPASLRLLERRLFSPSGGEEGLTEPDGGVRLLEVAGAQGEAEAIAAEVASLLRSGVSADEVLVVVPSVEAARGALERALAALEIPHAIDARIPLDRTPFGHALLGLCRFAWLGGGREDLFAWLRSPAAGIRRSLVDSWEGRIRGRGRRDGAAAYELLCELAGKPVDAVEALRGAASPVEALRGVLDVAAPAAFGLDARVRDGGPTALALRAWRAVDRALESIAMLAEPPTPAETVAVLQGVAVRVGDDRRAGRVRVVGLRRARTHRADVVLVAGLEEGRLPGRSVPDAFLSDVLRAQLAQHGVVLERQDRGARDRYLFYTAVTRARRQLVLLRRAVGDDGDPREPSPFWDEVRRVLGEAAPAPLRRGLGELTQPLDTAPSERERLRALAALAADESLLAQRIAAANGPAWSRRLARARSALARPTKLRDPELVAELAERTRFGVSELESFLDCSQAWFVQRVLDPHDIDGVVDPKTRGSVAHAALQRLYSRLPAALGKDVVDADDLERARPLVRSVVADSIAAIRLPPDSLDVLELGRSLERDLDAFLRVESKRGHRFLPRRLEVGFGSERSGPGLSAGLDLGGFAVSGRIDRIDQDPFSARGLVQDYKYSRRSHSAAQIGKERRLQLPLYVLALRDLLGLEPVGGVYRALLSGAEPRGMLRAEAREDGVEGFSDRDYLSEDEFWGMVDHAADEAREAVRRIRKGDVQHDPRQGSCPSWCDLHTICRVARA